MRLALALALVVLLVAGVPATASARTIELGTALNNNGFAWGGQAYRDALLRYDAYTPESATKMLELEPERGQWTSRAPTR